VLLSTFPGWHEETDGRTGSEIVIKPFPSRPVSKVIAWSLAVAWLFALVSALWQHVAASSAAFVLATTTQDHLVARPGIAAMALGWVYVVLLVAPFIMMVIIILSISLLDKLTDD